MGKRKNPKTDRRRASKKESSLNKPSNSLTNQIGFWGSISSITGISMITIAGAIAFLITILLFPSEKLYIISPPSKNIPVFKGVHFPTLDDMEGQIHPDSRDNLRYYLKNRNRKGNVKRNAIECLKITLENEKNNDNKIISLLHTAEAASYLEDGDLSKTIEILEIALSLDPCNLFALYYIQIAYEKSLDNLFEKNHSNRSNPQEVLNKIEKLHFKIKNIKKRIDEIDKSKNDIETYNNTYLISLNDQNFYTTYNTTLANATVVIDNSNSIIEEINSDKSRFLASFPTLKPGSEYLLDDKLIENIGNVSFINPRRAGQTDLWGAIEAASNSNIFKVYPRSQRKNNFGIHIPEPLPGSEGIKVITREIGTEDLQVIPVIYDSSLASVYAQSNDIYYIDFTNSRLKNAYSAGKLKDSIQNNSWAGVYWDTSHKTFDLTGATSVTFYASGSLLSVGIDSYENSSVWNSLDFAVSDAKKVAKAFARYGFKSTLLTNEEGSKLNILKHLVYESLISKPGDTFILYISGHGFSDINENKFILTYNKNRDLSDILSLKEIEASLGTHKGKVFIITDACFNKLYIDLKNHPSSKIKKIGNNHPVFLLASALGERSIESHKLGSSLATYSLLEFLNRSNIYGRKEYLDLNKMFAFVSTRTSALAQSIYGLNQNPILLHEGREYKISLDKGLNLVHSKR